MSALGDSVNALVRLELVMILLSTIVVSSSVTLIVVVLSTRFGCRTRM